MMELDGETSNRRNQACDCAPAGQAAPAEDIAKRSYASEKMVELSGIEPLTSSLRTRRSPN